MVLGLKQQIEFIAVLDYQIPVTWQRNIPSADNMHMALNFYLSIAKDCYAYKCKNNFSRHFWAMPSQSKLYFYEFYIYIYI